MDKKSFNLFTILTLFVILCVIRSIPELLAGWVPIGFDTITYYAPFIYEVQTGFLTPLIRVISSQVAPFTYIILTLFAFIPAHPLLIIKIASPVIFGFTGLVIYVFSKSVFRLNQQESFFLTVFICLNFVFLRFSWDMWRNLIGLIFYLLAIREILLSELTGKASYRIILFSLLCIVSHELITVLFASTLILLVLHNLIKKRYFNRLTMVLASMIIISILSIFFYAHWLNIFSTPSHGWPEEFWSGGIPLSFPYNYLSGGDWYHFNSYIEAVFTPLILLGFMFAPILPLMIKIQLKSKWLNIFIVICLISTVSIIIYPYAAIPVWHRWAFMLAIPLLMYSGMAWLKLNKQLKCVYLMVILVFAGGYMCLPPDNAFPYYSMTQVTFRYFPTSMLQNSVPLIDTPSVVNALKWLSVNAPINSCILTYEPFMGWVRMFVDSKITIIPYNLTTTSLERADELFEKVYLIWWVEGVDWYNWMPSPSFNVNYSIGRIAIYCYTP
ncbi:MAG: hypothetical protein ACTSYR_01050 [Candidatus Odinarchaeia archaeon]